MNNLTELLTLIVLSYPTIEVPPETSAAYMFALQDLPFEDVKQAAFNHVRASAYFPTIAELSAVYNARIEAQVPTALTAWGEVMQALKNAEYQYSNGVRRLVTPDWKHPLIGEIVQGFGGFQSIYDAQDDPQAFGFLREQFLKAYEPARIAVVRQAMSLPPMP